MKDSLDRLMLGQCLAPKASNSTQQKFQKLENQIHNDKMEQLKLRYRKNEQKEFEQFEQVMRDLKQTTLRRYNRQIGRKDRQNQQMQEKIQVYQKEFKKAMENQKDDFDKKYVQKCDYYKNKIVDQKQIEQNLEAQFDEKIEIIEAHQKRILQQSADLMDKEDLIKESEQRIFQLEKDLKIQIKQLDDYTYKCGQLEKDNRDKAKIIEYSEQRIQFLETELKKQGIELDHYKNMTQNLESELKESNKKIQKIESELKILEQEKNSQNLIFEVKHKQHEERFLALEKQNTSQTNKPQNYTTNSNKKNMQ